ncbi:MAG: hypothetical protein RLZZ157_1676 [Pseudomonadota bacterium]|jgi:post-segregation antitoxin (ccd killing protein)
MARAHKAGEDTPRETLNISVPSDLLVEATAAGIDVSLVAEAALARVVKEARLEIWAKENASALAALNHVIDQEGLPLKDRRLF